jgi:hypothetical protein
MVGQSLVLRARQWSKPVAESTKIMRPGDRVG